MHRHVLEKETNPSNRPKLGRASTRPDSPKANRRGTSARQGSATPEHGGWVERMEAGHSLAADLGRPRILLDAEEPATLREGRDPRGAGPGEGVEDDLVRPRRQSDQVRQQSDGFLGLVMPALGRFEIEAEDVGRAPPVLGAGGGVHGADAVAKHVVGDGAPDAIGLEQPGDRLELGRQVAQRAASPRPRGLVQAATPEELVQALGPVMALAFSQASRSREEPGVLEGRDGAMERAPAAEHQDGCPA